ncbi:cupin domain-containing protein [Methylobacterium nodulans]|uniref:Cupin 2 conserved barrel domain protein n=1 Tax=Methylobacterium nodulans (strain LMG 21967 / CNCM I-2342 / ORS 2060) TaxID=460265 RepID=B8IHK0_METNO|nr:cupin domain-containing protein [Methylobacterium nodulans]ACL61663.1 Cupin 2 conserved barrel domain protein [Methylobacterium nodulans ORS 2060]
MTAPTADIFADLPPPGSPDEVVTAILARPGLRIERIVSTGQASPPGFWYDQPEDEWVLLLAGAARLRIAGEAEARVLEPGDHLLLPAHLRHRVEWTSPVAATIWLCVYCQPSTVTVSPS